MLARFGASTYLSAAPILLAGARVGKGRNHRLDEP